MTNHHIYSDNFVLNVVDLSRIDLATDEDREYHIDTWAKMFIATTWEEVRKMAGQNEYLQEAAKSIFQFNTDEQIRKMCRDRVEYYQDLLNYQRFTAQQQQIILEKDITIAEKDAALAEKDNTITEKDNLIASLYAQIENMSGANEKLKH